MAFEVIAGEDCRFVFSHLKQSAYGTRLTDGNLGSGKSVRLNTATMGDISITRAQEGPRPFTGSEFNFGDERENVRDSAFSLALPANSLMLPWAAAFLLGSVASVQEGATTHYTHTIRPNNPLAVGQGRQALVTTIYLDTNGPDSGRLKRALPALAFSGLTLSWSRREVMSMAVDLVGSGAEDTAAAVTIPALTSVVDFTAGDVVTTYGDKGGALTDVSERFRDCSIRVNQQLALDEGYYPGSGKYRGRLWFIRRTFSIEMALWANRANRDFLDDMLNLTRKELKFTIDSGVVAGTGTVNHKAVIRFPDVRITESPMAFEDAGATWNVRVSENQVYKDAAVADSPVTFTCDNTQASYLT